jgi:hypothetical protein
MALEAKVNVQIMHGCIVIILQDYKNAAISQSVFLSADLTFRYIAQVHFVSSRPYALEEPRQCTIKIFILLLVLGVIEVGTSGSPAMVHGGIKFVRVLGCKWLGGDRLDNFLVLAPRC